MYSNLPKLVCVCLYVHVYIYIYMCVCVCLCVCVCVCVCVCPLQFLPRKCTTRSLSSKSKIDQAKFMNLAIFLPSDLVAEISPNPATH